MGFEGQSLTQARQARLCLEDLGDRENMDGTGQGLPGMLGSVPLGPPRPREGQALCVAGGVGEA